MSKAKVTVAFTREINPDFVSKRIMDFLKTDYSHVFFIHNGTIFHAVGEGVTEVPLAEYLKTHVIVAQKEVSLNVSDDRFLGYMDGAKDKEYSSSQYLGIISGALKRFGRNGGEKMICSELVAVVLSLYAGVKLPKESDFITPKDVFQLIGA
jgi:hypothetical protein